MTRPGETFAWVAPPGRPLAPLWVRIMLTIGGAMLGHEAASLLPRLRGSAS